VYHRENKHFLTEYPSQQLHSEVEVTQRSRCKQRNRVEKYLWSVPLRKRLRSGQTFHYWLQGAVIAVHALCDLFLAC